MALKMFIAKQDFNCSDCGEYNEAGMEYGVCTRCKLRICLKCQPEHRSSHSERR